ncbi:MAG: ABC transporter [Proteobacteria bacterium]|nr:MAG: ABC transporter [Pseudomonadota bacterium]
MDDAGVHDAAGDPAEPRRLASTGAFLAHYLRTWRGHFAGLLAMVVGAATCAVAIQYQMKRLVDAMAHEPRQVEAAQLALAGFVALVAAESVLWRLSGWLACRTTVGVGVAMRLDLFRRLSGQPMRYFADHLAGSLGHRVTATAGTFGALANTVIWRIVPPCVDFAGALVIFWLVDWRMALAMAGYVVAVTAWLGVTGERGRPLHRRYAERSSAVGGDLVDVIANMWSVKAFSAREREWTRLRSRFEDEAAAQRASWMYTERQRVVYDVVLWVMAASMLSWAVHRWTQHAVTLGDVVVVSALTFRILHGSRDVAIALVDSLQQLAFVDETLRVIDRKRTVVDERGAPALRRRAGTLELRKVCFRYERGREALHEVDVFIPAGQKVGIVGPSGAGKSTLVHLLQRLYDVQSGEILLDGQPIHRLQQDSLREALAVVPQEVTLFHRSVLDNIRFGRPDASDDEVFAAARAAACDGFVRRLPHGYDTIVGERGVKLSGGQRQRVGIARAFLKDAPILVLDEATSALDTESELRIQRSIVTSLGERTVIAVAHRLSTLAAFDRILVLHGGRLVEDGSAAELRARDGVFARLWRLQAEGALHGAVPAPFESEAGAEWPGCEAVAPS